MAAGHWVDWLYDCNIPTYLPGLCLYKTRLVLDCNAYTLSQKLPGLAHWLACYLKQQLTNSTALHCGCKTSVVMR